MFGTSLLRNVTSYWGVELIKRNFLNKYHIFLIVLFTLAMVYFLSRISFGINIYDEGLMLYGAVRILEGSIPYKDFWYVYTPGNLYFLALLFKVFGPSVLISRIFNSFILLLTLICSFIVSKDIVSDKISVFILFFLMVLFLGSSGGQLNNLALLFILLSCIFIFKYFNDKKMLNLILAGFFTGITAFFRLDFFLYIFFSISLTLIAFNYKNNADLNYGRLKCLIKSAEKWVIYLNISVITILPLIFFLILSVPFSQLISQFVTFPTQIYPEYRYLPLEYSYFIPTMTEIVIMPLSSMGVLINLFVSILFPIWIYSTISLWIFYKLISGIFGSIKDWRVILLLFLGVSLINHAIIRFDGEHLFSTMIVSIILFSYFSSEIIGINNLFCPGNTVKKSINIILKVLIIYLVIGSFVFCFMGPTIGDTTNSTPLDVERGYGIYVNHQDDFIAAVRYIQQNVPNNEKIFVGNSRHDKIGVNNVMFYFLAERDSATRYQDMHPGVVTTSQTQLEMINEIKQNNVHYIVLFKGLENWAEPNKSSQSSGVTVLDDFIQSNYQPIKTFGNYTIYLSKNNF